MGRSTKSIKRQLPSNESTIHQTKFDPKTNIIHNNNNNYNYDNVLNSNANNKSINNNGNNSRDSYNINNQLRIRSFPSCVNEVKFSDVNYAKCMEESTNAAHEINVNNCYAIGDFGEKIDKIDELNGSKLKIKDARSLDEESFISASTSMTIDTKKKPKIPDGGFGWVIVLSSFIISVIIDGIAFSFGLIFTELLNYFGESKTKTAWIGAFHLSVPLLAGPIISNLVDRYGCRIMTIIGGLISAIGFVLSAMSDSVEMLYLTFGLISGFGIGCGYVTAVVSIAFWFDKKRTFATSLGAAGTGIGTFCYAPFTNFLLERYGWRGTTLILAGTLLNVCVCGCLMRDPDWLIEENRLESQAQSILSASNSSVCLVEIRKLLEIGTPGETVLDTLVTNVNTEANQQMCALERTNTFKRYKSETLLPTYFFSRCESEVAINRGPRPSSLRQKNVSRENIFSIGAIELRRNALNQQEHSSAARKVPKLLASVETMTPSDDKYSINDSNNTLMHDALRLPTEYEHHHRSTVSLDERFVGRKRFDSINDGHRIREGKSLNAIQENSGIDRKINMETFTINLPLPDHEHQLNEKIQNNVQNNHRGRHHHHRHNNTGEIVSNLRRNIPLRHSHHFQHMRIHRKAMTYRNAMLNTHRYHLKASSCPNIYRNSMTTLAKEEEDKWYDSFIDIITSIFDFSMFLDPTFFYFNLSTLLLFICYIVPYFSITDHLKKYNYTEADGANLISVIGIFNTVGMIGLGYVGDKPWLNVSKTYAISLVVCGISTIIMPFAVHNYTYLLLLAMVFGISFSSSFSFIPILTVQIVDLEDFSCAYGLVLLVQGIGSLIGPPLMGIIYDSTNRWDDAFYAAGVCIIVAGILAWVTGKLVERDEADDEESES